MGASEQWQGPNCAYCAAHCQSEQDWLGWRPIAEPDGPSRGLPPEWWCCPTCRYADVPHKMRVRRRFDYVLVDLFMWGGYPNPPLAKKLAAIDSAAGWLLDDLVARGVLEREEWRDMVIYRDPRPIWTRVASRIRRWWRARK